MNSLPVICDGLMWRISDGTSVRIGLDPWMGCGNAHLLPEGLLQSLTEKGITRICHIVDQERSTFLHQAWKSAHTLLLPLHWHQPWRAYTLALTESHIHILEGEDEITWAIAKNGRYSPKEGYLHLANRHKPLHINIWWKRMWKLKAPLPRTRLLMWSILNNKVPTGDNLIKRGLYGPYWCCLCKDNTETVGHLFLSCPTTTDLWNSILSHIPSTSTWRGKTTKEVWANWWTSTSPQKARKLPLLISWEIWIARNNIIF